ncbi:MAG: hypothetical protein KGY81_10350, partial [Phycisphaerae bacterium]|nr:hypothetical protein [Phycisphaerae bacterium]
MAENAVICLPKHWPADDRALYVERAAAAGVNVVRMANSGVGRLVEAPAAVEATVRHDDRDELLFLLNPHPSPQTVRRAKVSSNWFKNRVNSRPIVLICCTCIPILLPEYVPERSYRQT